MDLPQALPPLEDVVKWMEHLKDQEVYNEDHNVSLEP